MRPRSHQPRLLRRLVVTGAIGGLLAVGALVAALVFLPDREVPLSSGKRLCYLGATWGTRHRCLSGKRWQRALLAVFPLPQLFGG